MGFKEGCSWAHDDSDAKSNENQEKKNSLPSNWDKLKSYASLMADGRHRYLGRQVNES